MAKKDKPLRHPWLDANDPANTESLSRHALPGFWVPTPAQIESGAALAREQSLSMSRLSLGGVDERRFARPPQQISLSHRKEIFDDSDRSDLCDCPYWGTEFKDFP